MAYSTVNAPNGQHLFKYDPTRQLIEIKCPNLGLLTIDLLKYQQLKAPKQPQPQPDAQPEPTDTTPAE